MTRRDTRAGDGAPGARTGKLWCDIIAAERMSLNEPDTTDFSVVCPYCGEAVEVYLEPDVRGSLVIDCEVCCQPWQVHVTREGDYRYLDVRRGDGSE